MHPIPTLDLAAQHAPLQRELEAAAARVLASNRFICGAEVESFESEVSAALEVPHAVGVSSGTDALLALLMIAGVRSGDEVLTTPYSFFATAEVIARLHARPVFVDIDPETMNVDERALIARIDRRARAVVLAHLFGRVAVTPGIAAACREAGVTLIEDAAQAIGARGGAGSQVIGTVGAGAALSFFPSKNLGGFGDAGMVLTADPQVADGVRSLRNHGSVERLRHDRVGGNFRLDELQAALLRVKLPLLAGWTAERRRLAALYRRALTGLPLRLPPADEGCVWNQFVVRVPGQNRDALAHHLAVRSIATAVYYPLPLHLQPALAFLGHRPGDFPEAERASAEALALPIYPGLSDEGVTHVARAAADFFS